jgi:uncharacterized protein YbbK (DUF523 family)
MIILAVKKMHHGNISKTQGGVSRCLNFANCRYSGGIIQDSFISRLMPYVEFLTV